MAGADDGLLSVDSGTRLKGSGTGTGSALRWGTREPSPNSAKAQSLRLLNT